MIEVHDPELDGLSVLEIGGGDCRLAGAIQVEIDTRGCDRWVRRWGTDSLPFNDGVFDLVYASHVLEHVHWTRTIAALQEALRVLTPHGSIELWVPDFAYLDRAYRTERESGGASDPSPDDWLSEAEHQGQFMRWLNGRLFSANEGDPHRAAFDYPYLAACLLNAGFRDVERIYVTRTRDHGPIQLGVRARKP